MWEWVPRLPSKEVSDQTKALRLATTVKYGYITFITTVVVLLLIPYWSRISKPIIFGIYSRIVSRFKSLRFRSNYLTLNLEVIKCIMFWLFVLTVLSGLELHSDIQFLAARLGRVATYCLPTILFLTLRPSPLPDTLYLSLLPIHKWLSRIIIFQCIAHTALYVWIFVKRDTIPKIWKRDNLYGIYALIAFVLIFLTSLPKIRRKLYNLFFAFHYICTWISVLTLYVHVRPSIPYLTTLNVAILLYQIYYRYKISIISTVDVAQLSSNLLLVTVPNSAIASKSFIPGCHLRMIEYEESNFFKQLWRVVFAPVQHPYTISTLPIDQEQQLIVRKGKFDICPGKKYIITGAYLPYLNFMKPVKSLNPRSLLFNTDVKKCLIVVGGSAISFALPILRTLSYNGVVVKIIWVLKDHEDLKVLDFYQNILVNDDCIDIFITGKYTGEEIFNFKRAVRELHRFNRQSELINQEQMLSGSYPPNYHEKSPLFQPKTSYSATSSDTPEWEQEHMTLNSKIGYIPIKNHYEDTKSGYNAEDEDKFENVDLDLEGKCRSPQSTTARKYSLFSGILDIPKAVPEQRTPSNVSQTLSSGIYDDLADYWILKGLPCRIEFGRPRLGLYYYNWCIGSSCIGPLVDLKSGESVCCNEVTLENKQQTLQYKKSNGQMLGSNPQDDLFLNEQFMRNRTERFQKRGGKLDETTLVVGAGPTGLVNKVRLWANDCGFQFHAESFSV